MTDPLCYSSGLAFENQNQRGKAMKYQLIFSLLCPFEAPNTGPRSGPSVLLAFQTLPEGSTLKQLAGSSESQENSVSWREKRRSQSLLAGRGLSRCLPLAPQREHNPPCGAKVPQKVLEGWYAG